MQESITLHDGEKRKWPFWVDIEGLQAYLDEVWQNRPIFLREDEEEERRNTEQRFFDISTEAIKARSYVGFVQYGNLKINVYPRVFNNRSGDEVDLPFAINHVLHWLRYSSRLHFPFSEAALHLQSQDDWLEALIYLFANYTSEALSNSPHFTYQEVTEETAFVRGRIAIQPYINHNLSKGRHHLVHCTYEPFVYDNLFNRIVKHTCRVLQAVTANPGNKTRLENILFLLDEVTDVYCTADDCARVQVNRLYPEVGIITNMCSAFLSNQAYSDGLNNSQNLCILLPMEVICEQYIAGFIRKHFPKLNAIPQASGEYVAMTGEDFKKPVFRMKHDILLPDKVVIDTKYKFRYNTEDLKAGVSQADMYQMVTYCYKRNIKRGLLLYPKHFGENAKNERHVYKVEDMLIDACSIDITENDLDTFDDEQKLRFASLLQEWIT